MRLHLKVLTVAVAPLDQASPDSVPFSLSGTPHAGCGVRMEPENPAGSGRNPAKARRE
jgi:hypothetical protein